MFKNIGFILTSFSGIDGVSFEASKWAEGFEQNGHRCFWFAGELDRDPDTCYLVPDAYFQTPKNNWINARVFGQKRRDSEVTELIYELRYRLKLEVHQFINRYDIDLLIVENALITPIQIPLGLAPAKTIAEAQIPTIAHYHDFYWERVRFSVNAVGEYLRMAFPSGLPNISHVVINSTAHEELALRTGILAIIPNVIDFDNPPHTNSDVTGRFRKSIGLRPEDIIFLQLGLIPTPH